MPISVARSADAIIEAARALGELLSARHLVASTAESCTGGMIAAAITDIAGSSGWFDRGFVTYSNEAKREMLGVDDDVLVRTGAVSEATAAAMVQGALARSRADVAVAVTGIAGPGGATPGKPVGTVCFAWARRGGTVVTSTEHFPGERAAVRAAAVRTGLAGLMDMAARA